MRAARRLHISQPALSGQIRKLEEELAVQLFRRNRRTVQLTEAGKVFLNEARAVLDRAGEAVDRVRRAERGEIGRLRVGFVSTAALETVPAMVVAFRRRYPDVALDLLNHRTVSQIHALLDKSIDIGFLRLPLAHDQLDIRIIHREPFVVALPSAHRLARTRRLSLAALRHENFVVYGRRWAPGFFDSVIRLCLAAGFSPNIVQETGEMYTAVALVAAGVGCAILPQSVVLAQSKNVVMRPLPPSAGISEIAIATRKGDTSPLVRSFVSLAAAFYSQQRRRGGLL